MFEQIIELIAPHICLQCKKEGSLLCRACQSGLAAPPLRCHMRGHIPCASCPKLLKKVFAATAYEGLAKEVIHKLKFGRAQAAADAIAQVLAERMPPIIGEDTVVSFIPTATGRVRVRGYDQAALIARRVARLKGAPCLPLLVRFGQQRQVGQSKATRRKQLRNVFRIREASQIANRHILLVDDVLTTGATVEVAAAALYEAGARRVDAAVFAAA